MQVGSPVWKRPRRAFFRPTDRELGIVFHGGVNAMEQQMPLVFDQRWYRVLAGATWFTSLMLVTAYGLTVR